MAQDAHFADGETIMVETPAGWRLGTYVCCTSLGKHIVECPTLWYGFLSMDDTKHIRKGDSE
jgi:hypothetical protein